VIIVWDRIKAFIVKAGTIIFVASAIIWFMQSYSWTLQSVNPEDSILGSIGKFIAPIFVPLGFGNWQATVAILTGIVAKENVVATFGILGGEATVLVQEIFTPISGYAFMTFILLASPCLAAIGATKKELGSWKETTLTILFQTGTAYVVSLIVYLIGLLIIKVNNWPTILISIGLVILILLAIGKSIKTKGCPKGCNSCHESCNDYKKTSR
jgi:ferrous iron transport protein B